MKTVLVIAVSLAALGPGCAKPPKAEATQCQAACSRVADLRTAPEKAKMQTGVHELDEAVERTEDEADKNLKELRRQLAEPAPKFDPKPYGPQPAKTLKELQERQKWEQDQLRQQRTLGIQHLEEAVATAKADYEKAKAKAAAEGKRITDEAFKACDDTCVQRPATFAACLQRIQAVEDIAVCERQ